MRVLFVCTANSCRSQMAEAWARRLFPVGWEVQSAGLVTYRITEPTRQAVADAGLDLAGHRPKTIDEFDLDDFDLVVTLSHEAARFLPALARPERHLHWAVADPMELSGTDEQVQAAFRKACAEISDIVQQVIAGAPGVSGSAPDGDV